MSTDPFGLVGQVLDGQFRVDEIVGEGGFSAVYRGHHVGLNEPIAIKSLKLPVALQTSLVDTFVQRFRDESRLLYRLSQGNLHIVRSIAAGTTTSKTGVLVPFMVLEWLNGRSLAADFTVRRDLGKTGRSLAEVLQTFATAADALSFAHAQGVVHRDLNPGNFFLSSTPAGIKMKVLDFGVAKVMHDSTLGLGPRAQTMGQFRIFAPAYGAPEQFDDNIGNIGTASDVYSFALVLLEALRDAPVNEGQNLADFARFAVDPARRPTPRLFGIQVSDEVEAVFARATQLDPRKRWQTVAELWDALTSAQSATDRPPVLAKPAPVGGPAPKTLPLGATFPFPRPAPRPAAGAPATGGVTGARPASNPSIAKSTQRFGNALPAPASIPSSPSSGGKASAAAPSSASGGAPGDARPTSRPGAPQPPRPPSGPPRAAGADDEDGDEPTKVATTDPRILEMAQTGALPRDSVRETAHDPMAAARAKAPASTFEDDEDPTTATEKPPPRRLPPSMPPIPAAGRPAFGETIAMAEPPAHPPVAEEEDIERAPDSGGTLIMAPGQVTGQPLPASAPASSGGMPAAPPHAPGAFASTVAFSSPQTPRLSGPAPDAAWPSTQLSPGAPPPGQSQMYAQGQGGMPMPEQLPPGQSQLYVQGGYPQQHGAPGANMYPAHMHSASMPGQPMQGGPQPYAAGASFPAQEPPPAKKVPVAVLAVAGLLLLLGLGGIAAFLMMGRNEKGPGPVASASASAAASETPPVPAEPTPTAPPVVPVVAEVVDAGAAAPAAEPDPTPEPTPAATAATPTATAAPTPTTAPTYTWPPPASTGQAPTPVSTAHAAVPTPVAVRDAGSSVDPNAFSESAARARLSQANGVLIACKREGGVSGPGKALVTFAPDGTVVAVALDAPYVGTKEGDCAARQFQRAKVNAFNGGPQTVKHSFEIPK